MQYFAMMKCCYSEVATTNRKNFMPLAHYFVTDVETNGPSPAENSMLSFACVAVSELGEIIDEFETVLKPRTNRVSDEGTMKWWKTQPKAWLAATTNPKAPEEEMKRFHQWIESFSGLKSFAARPVAFDGIWIDRYLRDFTDSYLLDCPHWGKNIFTADALDIGTYMSGIFNRTAPHTGDIVFPSDWLGNHEHTHHAIDDARGYASVLSKLLKIAKLQPPHPNDFLLQK